MEKQVKKEVVIREGMPTTIEDVEVSHEEYYEEKEKKSERKPRKKKKGKKRLIVILIIVLVIIGILFIKNTKYGEDFEFWFKTKIVGIGVGDGFPVDIIGSKVQTSNFTTYNGNCAVLSDTAFTLYSPMGKQLKSVRHNLTNPVLKNSGDDFLIYTVGGGSLLSFKEKTTEKKITAAGDIISADISNSGRYAVASLSTDYACEFNVYLPNGNVKYNYKFSENYISDIELNDDGTKAVVSVLYSSGGVICSDIYIFDLNQPEPIEKYTTVDNMVTTVVFNNDNQVYAVGDNKTVGISNEKIREYDYENKMITAMCTENNRVVLSISGSENIGSCEVWIFDGSSEPVELEIDQHATQISSFGASFSILTSSNVISYDLRGNPLGKCEIQYDTKSIAMANETDIYLLGLKQVVFQSQEPLMN